MRPWLKPGITIVQTDQNICLLVSNESELLKCSGKTVALLQRILPLCDGTRSLSDLHAQLPDVLPGLVDDVVALLARNRALVDLAEQREAGAPSSKASLLGVLARMSDEAVAVAQRLEQARVCVVGDSPLAEELAHALLACGIGRISWVAGPPAVPDASIDRYESADLAQALTGCTFAVGIQDGDFALTDVLSELNRLCVASRRSWLQLRLTLRGEAWVGPVHADGETCFACFTGRLRGNLRYHREQEQCERFVRDGLAPVKRIDFQPFRSLAANLGALEVFKFVSGADTGSLLSKCRIVDLLRATSSEHAVLRHPFCAVCVGQPTPRVYPWDEDEVQLERSLIRAG